MSNPARVAGSGSLIRQTPPFGGDKLFIFGLGYSAQAVAKAALAAGFSVSGTVRNPEKIAAAKALGIEIFAFDAIPENALKNATHILSSVPTVESLGDVVLEKYREFLQGKKWLGYFSTTGVYGDSGGAWVDENSELRPNNARLHRRVAAEKEWLAHGAHIFRLAGIYGPGRNAVEDVLAGQARRIDKQGQVFSRIHVEDIAQALLASMKKPNPGRIYNMCDDAPAPQREVVEYACELLHKPFPPLVTPEAAGLSPLGLEFYRANRRVRNQRIKHELDITLTYPSYREGLAHIARNFNLV